MLSHIAQNELMISSAFAKKQVEIRWGRTNIHGSREWNYLIVNILLTSDHLFIKHESMKYLFEKLSKITIKWSWRNYDFQQLANKKETFKIWVVIASISN